MTPKRKARCWKQRAHKKNRYIKTRQTHSAIKTLKNQYVILSFSLLDCCNVLLDEVERGQHD